MLEKPFQEDAEGEEVVEVELTEEAGGGSQGWALPRPRPQLEAATCCGGPPSTESIVAWLSSEIRFQEQHLMVEPGRLYFCGIPRDVDRRIHEMLQPVFSHISREDHCERYGLLHQVRAIVRRRGHGGIEDCSGRLSMYVSHFPCISCVAVVCQFIRAFPSVRVEMDYDNMWQTRFSQGRKNAKPDAWKVFDVMEGKVADLPC